MSDARADETLTLRGGPMDGVDTPRRHGCQSVIWPVVEDTGRISSHEYDAFSGDYIREIPPPAPYVPIPPSRGEILRWRLSRAWDVLRGRDDDRWV